MLPKLRPLLNLNNTTLYYPTNKHVLFTIISNSNIPQSMPTVFMTLSNKPIILTWPIFEKQKSNILTAACFILAVVQAVRKHYGQITIVKILLWTVCVVHTTYLYTAINKKTNRFIQVIYNRKILFIAINRMWRKQVFAEWLVEHN